MPEKKKKKGVQALVVWSQLHQRDTKVKPNGERRRSMVMTGRRSLVGWRERCCASSRMRRKAQAACDKKCIPHATSSASHSDRVRCCSRRNHETQTFCTRPRVQRVTIVSTFGVSAPDKLGPNNRGTILKLASPRPKTTLRHLARAQHW